MLEALKNRLKEYINAPSETNHEGATKQKTLQIIAIGFIVIVVVVFLVSLDDDETDEVNTNVATEQNDTNYSSIFGNDRTLESSVMNSATGDIAMLKKQNEELKAKLETIEAKKKTDEDQDLGKVEDKPKQKDLTSLSNLTGSKQTLPDDDNFFTKTPITKPTTRYAVMKNSLVVDDAKEPQGAVQQSEIKKKIKTIYVPAGTITRAVTLGGIIAPTMTNAKGSPMPVLMRIKDDSIAANLKKLNLKECFVLGEGAGNLADERVHIRLKILTCIDPMNNIYETDISGLVSSAAENDRPADGTPGLPGEVISKNGATLGRALIAGFLQGVGQAFSMSSTTMSASALGTTTTQSTEPEKIMESSLYRGGAASASKLAEYYMKMASAVEPVIQVKGRRWVDLLFDKGFKLKQVNVDNEDKPQPQPQQEQTMPSLYKPQPQQKEQK